MIRLCLIAFAVSAACGADDATTYNDAAVDGPAPGTFGAECTTVSDMSTECDSGICTNVFNMFPYPVCSQKCTVLQGIDPTCPSGSMGQKCNMQGYCRP